GVRSGRAPTRSGHPRSGRRCAPRHVAPLANRRGLPRPAPYRRPRSTGDTRGVGPDGTTHRARAVRWLRLAARVVVPIALLALLVIRVGAGAFRDALDVLAPLPLLGAILLGGVALSAQAARWRIVSAGAGIQLGRRQAIAEVYRAGALNVVLP